MHHREPERNVTKGLFKFDVRLLHGTHGLATAMQSYETDWERRGRERLGCDGIPGRTRLEMGIGEEEVEGLGMGKREREKVGSQTSFFSPPFFLFFSHPSQKCISKDTRGETGWAGESCTFCIFVSIFVVFNEFFSLFFPGEFLEQLHRKLQHESKMSNLQGNLKKVLGSRK